MKHFFVIFVVCILSVFSQSEKTVVVTGEFVGTVAPSVGHQKAREDAINLAIEQAVGINVTTTTNMFKKEVNNELIESYSNYFSTFSNATVKTIKKLKRQMIPLEEEVLKFIYTAEITLVVDENGIDPGFSIKTVLNKPAFIEGQNLQVSVETTKDAFITILTLTQNNEVLVLFPNKYMTANFLEAKSSVTVPSKMDMDRGIVFETENETNKQNISELIIVLATKEEIPMLSKEHDSGFEMVSENEFQEWMSKIPLNMRTMDTKIYDIFNK